MSEIERVRDTAPRWPNRVARRAMTALPFVSHEGVVSPYVVGANPYITPVWRDCTPARLSLGVSVLTTNNGANFGRSRSRRSARPGRSSCRECDDGGAGAKPVAPARPDDVCDCALARERREPGLPHHRENGRAGRSAGTHPMCCKEMSMATLPAMSMNKGAPAPAAYLCGDGAIFWGVQQTTAQGYGYAVYRQTSAGTTLAAFYPGGQGAALSTGPWCAVGGLPRRNRRWQGRRGAHGAGWVAFAPTLAAAQRALPCGA